MRVYLRLILVVIVGFATAFVVFAQTADTTDPLVRVLQTKGILTESEAHAITANASPAEQRDRLAVLLRDKGVLSATEFESLRTPSASAEVKTITAEYKTSAPPPVSPAPQQTPPPVIAAVAPVRLLGIDVPKWLYNDLKHSKDILSASVHTCKNIAVEIMEYASIKKIPIGFNIESVSIKKDEIEAANELLVDILRLSNLYLRENKPLEKKFTALK